MTAPTEVQGTVGLRMFISATAPETVDEAGFTSTDIVWTEIEQIGTPGNHGGTKNVNTFIPVKTGTVAKIGGSTDYGTMSMMLGNLYSDAGQRLLETAFGQRNTHYSFKMQYDDGNAVTDETHYFRALVSQFERQDGDANGVRQIACTLNISSNIVVVAPT